MSSRPICHARGSRPRTASSTQTSTETSAISAWPSLRCGGTGTAFSLCPARKGSTSGRATCPSKSCPRASTHPLAFSIPPTTMWSRRSWRAMTSLSVSNMARRSVTTGSSKFSSRNLASPSPRCRRFNRTKCRCPREPWCPSFRLSPSRGLTWSASNGSSSAGTSP